MLIHNPVSSVNMSSYTYILLYLCVTCTRLNMQYVNVDRDRVGCRGVGETFLNWTEVVGRQDMS